MISSHTSSRYSLLFLSVALSVGFSFFCSFPFLLRWRSSTSFIRCIDHFLCNRCLSCFPVDFPNQVTVCIYHTFNIVSHHFHIPIFIIYALKFSSGASCPSCRRACNLSRSHLGFPFWNFMNFFNTVQIFANSKLWSEPISASGIVRTYTLSVFFLDTTEVHS